MRFKGLYILFVPIFWLNTLYSQNLFDIKLASDYYRSFIVTKDSGIVTHVPEPNAFSNGGTILKIDKYGVLTDSIFNLKLQTVGAYHTILNSKDGFLIVGETKKDLVEDGIGWRDIIVEKTDFDGNILWQLPLEGSTFCSAIKTKDGNFLLLINEMERPVSAITDVAVYKINEEGEIIWKKVFGNKFIGIFDDSYREYAVNIIDINNSYYLIYENFLSGLSVKQKILKLNHKGDVLWEINEAENLGVFKGIVTVFSLNKKIYFVSNNYQVFEIDDSNGNYFPIKKRIVIHNFGGDFISFTNNCNELINLERVEGKVYFNKYKTIDSAYSSVNTGLSSYVDIQATPDGGYIVMNWVGKVTKMDCFGNTDFWDERCTNRLKVDNKVVVYPNPSNSIVNIETNFNINTIILIDELGKEVVLKNYCNCKKQIIDITSYSQGHYFLKIMGINSVEVRSIFKY